MQQYKNYRNPKMVEYFNSRDFDMDCHLNETYHEVRYFDDFLDDLPQILEEHEDEIMFYTDWNYKPMKESYNGHTRKYGICRKECNPMVDIPIYFYLYNREDESYTSVNRKSNQITISINTFNLNVMILRFELLHEFTHVVCDYSEQNFANLDSLRNTISYEDNIFGVDDRDFDEICQMLYWLNKSEQDARIGATLKYVREKRIERGQIERLNDTQVYHYIEETYFLNQLDKFLKDVKKINELTDKQVYIIGFYMQMHHYMFGKLYKEIVEKAIKDNQYNQEIILNIRNEYYRRFKDYRMRLYRLIVNQVI